MPRHLFFLLGILGSSQGFGICETWSDATKSGELDPSLVFESSGLAVSAVHDNRLYHINDSGDGPAFYRSKLDGSKLKRIEIKKFEPIDVEDLAYGPCGKGKNCIIVGDIGDNLEIRESIKLAVIEEKVKFLAKVKPRAVIEVKYPDGPHNAESMALHPNGDLFILTKEHTQNQPVIRPMEMYRVTKEQWQNPGSEPASAEFLGSFDMDSLIPDPGHPVLSRLTTAMDISQDGKRLAVLTYEYILEFDLDLAESLIPRTEEWVHLDNYQIVEVDALPQQEAVAYHDDGLLFSTEYHHPVKDMLKIRCLD